MRPYSPGGVLNALAAAQSGLKTAPHLALNVYGWDYQGIYTSVTSRAILRTVLTKFPWRIPISEDLSLLPVRSDCVITRTGEFGASVQSLRGS